MKKLLSLVLSFIIVLSLFNGVSVSAYEILSGTCGDNLTWTVGPTGDNPLNQINTLTISGTGDMYDYESGEAPWFQNGFTGGKIVIEEGVTSIGARAFHGYSHSSYVDLFVELPETLKSIGEGAFYNWQELQDIDLKNVEYIGNRAFYNCKEVKNITFPQNLKSIGQFAFDSCVNLRSAEIKGEIKKIEYGAFRDCEALNTVLLPDTVEIIERAAFRDCTALRSINIPDGVTSIGMSAFSGCKKLPSINIPDSVTVIGDNAFQKCSSLTTIHIPKGISVIEYNTFSECTELVSVEIPSAVTKIESGAFYNCEALTDVYYGGSRSEWDAISIGTNNEPLLNATVHFNSYFTPTTIKARGECGDNVEWIFYTDGTMIIKGTGDMYDYSSNTVRWNGHSNKIKRVIVKGDITRIGSYAFGSCYSLESVIIPSSVKNIGAGAFNLCVALAEISLPKNLTSVGAKTFTCCQKLEKVIIPKKVTYIGDNAFSDCTELKEIVLPDGLESIGIAAFRNCKKLDNIVIPESVTSIAYGAFAECTSLSYMEFPDGITEINNTMFTNCTALKSVRIPDTVTKVYISAFYGCTALETVYYSGSESQWNSIVFEKNNEAVKNANIVFNSNTQQKTYFAGITYNGKLYDLLTQPINIDKNSSASVSVKVNYDNFTGNEKIWLSQDPTKAVELDNNVAITFVPTDVFDADKDIYILIVNEETGEANSYRTRLKVTGNTAGGEWLPDSGVSGLNFRLGGKTGLTIPDNVPVFGGTEINWDFGFIPVSVEYDREDNNKINIVFGANIVSSDGEEDKFFKDFSFKEYKKDFKTIAYMKDGRTLQQLRNHYKVFNKDNKMSLFGGNVIGGGSGKTGFDFNVAGYAEAKIVNGEFTFIEGQIVLEAEVSYTYQGQLFIWVVPVYYEIGGGIGAGFEGNMIDISPETFEPQFEAYLTAKIKATLGAGVGIAKAATVGVAGEGSLNLKTALHKDYLKAWGEGSANFNVKVFGKEVAKKDFIKGEFLIFETGNANGMIPDSSVSLMSLEEDIYESIDINAVYPNESRNETPAEWYGNMPPVSLFSTEYTNKNLQLLAENVYTESAPQMQEIDGKKVMVMLWDNETRDASNRTMLVYSVYDDEEKTWSEPLPVYDDGTADFYPVFNDGYLVWQNEKTELSDAMTLSEIGALGEICVAKWNGEGFDTPVVLTNNNTLDTQPFVTADDTTVTVVWIANSENDIIGLTGRNSIMKSVSFGAPEVLKDNLNPIINLSAGYIDDALNIAYVEDTDNDLSTVNEREIVLITEDTEYALTENDVLDGNPVFENNTIYYYSDGNILYGNGEAVFKEAKPGLTDTFTVSSNGTDVAVWWAKSTDEATEIFCALYNDGEWSDEIKVSDTGNISKYPTGILKTDGSMYIAYNNSIVEDSEVTQTDLYTIDLVPTYDLMVTDAYFDENNMTAYVTVKNVGEEQVGNFMVGLFDVGINTYKEFESLKAGESIEVELKYNVPLSFTKCSVTAIAYYTEDEYNVENNFVTFNVGNCDVEITEVRSYEKLPSSEAVVVIANNGYSDSGEVTVSLRRDTVDGEIVDTEVIDNIAAGAMSRVSFEFDIASSENITWYVTAETGNTEISKGNNDAFFINDYVRSFNLYSQAILSYSIEDGTLTAIANLESNEGYDFTDTSTLVLCDKDGIGKDQCSVQVKFYPYSSTTVEYKIYNYTPEKGDYLLLYTPDFESHTVDIDTGEDTFTVSGTVTAFGDTAKDITVELLGADTKTVTGNSGTYAFENVEAGTYTLRVSKSKHAVREYEVTVADSDVTQNLAIWLYGDVNCDGIVNAGDTLQINRKIANMSSVFNQTADADYRFKVANVTNLVMNDIIINATDILQINRKVANLSSVFDKIA